MPCKCFLTEDGYIPVSKFLIANSNLSYKEENISSVFDEEGGRNDTQMVSSANGAERNPFPGFGN